MLFSFSVGQYGVKQFKYFNSTCFKFVVAKELLEKRKLRLNTT